MDAVQQGFFFGEIMTNKKQLRYIDQLALLKLRGVQGIHLEWSLYNRNLNIRKRERYYLQRQLSDLSTLGYYQLKDYLYPYRKGSRFSNISFRQMRERYYQDKRVRQNTLHAIEDIEVTLNTKIAYVLGDNCGAYGYLNFSNWCQHNTYNPYFKVRRNNRWRSKFMSKDVLQDEQVKFIKEVRIKIIKSRTPDVVRLRKESDTSDVPIWLLMNELTLGNSIHLYKLMKPKLRKLIADYFNCTTDELISWLECLRLIRNICCHNGNLADLQLKTRPRAPREFINQKILYTIPIKDHDGNLRRWLITNRIALPLAIIVHLMRCINQKYNFHDLNSSIKNLINDSVTANYYGFRDSQSVDLLFYSHFKSSNEKESKFNLY